MFYNLTFAKLNFHNFANWMFYAYIRFHIPQFAKCIFIHVKQKYPAFQRTMAVVNLLCRVLYISGSCSAKHDLRPQR